MLPILLILLSGLFEFGFIFTHYLAVLDSARNAARFSSDSQFDITDGITDCTNTKDFYRQTACLAVVELADEQPTIDLCLPNSTPSDTCDPTDWDNLDDVIVSAFSVLRKGGTEVRRFPEAAPYSPIEGGWSYAVDLTMGSQSAMGLRTGLHNSNYTSAKIQGMLQTGTPNTGYILVEVNYNYHHVLGLPWFTQFVPNPLPFRLYAIWPLVSAEPTSTPK